MTPRDFCFWLQGYFEIGGSDTALSGAQIAMLRKHLDSVFEAKTEPAMPFKQEGQQLPEDFLQRMRERVIPATPGPFDPPLTVTC